MFLPTSETIRKQHPQLDTAVELIDDVLSDTRTKSILDPHRLSRFGQIDRNRIESALECYADAGVLQPLVVFRCEECDAVTYAARAKKERTESGESRCSSCNNALLTNSEGLVYLYHATPAVPGIVDPTMTDLSKPQQIMSAGLTDREVALVDALFDICFQDEDDVISFLQKGPTVLRGLAAKIKKKTKATAIDSLREQAHSDALLGLVLAVLATAKPARKEILSLAWHFEWKYKTNSDEFRSRVESLKSEFIEMNETKDGLEGLTSYSPFFDVDKLQQWIMTAKRRICKIKCHDVEKGTGFLISDSLVLTCFHVIESSFISSEGERQDTVEQVAVQFDYWSNHDGTCLP